MDECGFFFPIFGLLCSFLLVIDLAIHKNVITPKIHRKVPNFITLKMDGFHLLNSFNSFLNSSIIFYLFILILIKMYSRNCFMSIPKYGISHTYLFYLLINLPAPRTFPPRQKNPRILNSLIPPCHCDLFGSNLL